MSSVVDSGTYYSDKSDKECSKSPNGKHKYEITCGTLPSCEMTCKYCKDRFYTK